MEILLLKGIVFCFSMGIIMTGIAGWVLFIQYINKFGSTMSTIIYSGIILISLVSIAANLKYMGIPFIVMYGTIMTGIGYTTKSLTWLKIIK